MNENLTRKHGNEPAHGNGPKRDDQPQRNDRPRRDKRPKRNSATLAALLCALALLAVFARAQEQPPKEEGTFRAPELVELTRLDPTLKLDIRYATANNFTHRPVYTEARAFLQRPAAEALLRVSRALRKKGYGLAVFDAYRPWSVTKLFWDMTPADKKQFVADPSKGSRHNRGCAIDLTLYELRTGREVSMTGEYDEMSERSHISYAGGTSDERRLRDLLRAAMEAEGFAVYEPEWWHYDYKDWRQYPILNLGFSEIGKPRAKAAGATHTK
jgi:D-alanyl-D-alanine dipeptidase